MSDGVLREQLAVLGSPIAHSKSPAIHAAAYAHLGLDWEYGRQELQASALGEFLASRSARWRGLSLTMPLKEEAHRLATVLDPVAAESGVVNTLLRLVEGAGWAGFNTDVGGLAAAVSGAGLDATRTVVLGTGATAVSAILAARRLGAEQVVLIGRNWDAMEDLVRRFSGTHEPENGRALDVSAVGFSSSEGSSAADALTRATLVISTLPGSAAGGVALPPGIERVPLFDVAYDTWPSPLAERWRAVGSVATPGTDMLVEQAILQIRTFVGGDPSLQLEDESGVRAVMRAAAVE